ncbi:hypothetical protein Q5752_006863 [Cryptotrichosporon argae]
MDDDEGDISLAIPRSASDQILARHLAHERRVASSPITGSGPPAGLSASEGWPEAGASDGTRTKGYPAQLGVGSAPPTDAATSAPMPFSRHLWPKGREVSLNDEGGPTSRAVSASRPATSSGYPSSSAPGMSTLTARPDALRTPPAPRPVPVPRTSSISRSRSLNVRIPSSGSGSPSAASPPGPGQPASAVAARGSPSLRLGSARRPGEPRPPPLVGTDVARRVGRWVKEVVVCNFDLERGPVVERRALGRRWGPGEKENVAFSSFPDTSLFAEGSITFSFKIRHIPPSAASLARPEPPSPMPDRLRNGPARTEAALVDTSPPAVDDAVLAAATRETLGQKSDEYRRWDESGREWLFGFVWFEQRKDKGIARGYMQKSVVVLTHLPFPALFFAALEKIAPRFFEYGHSALEVACHSIATWPDPIADAVLELPLLSDLLTVRLPDSTESPQVGQAFAQPNPSRPLPLLASLPRSTPLRAFATFLPSLWSLWECLVLAEPVLVIAPDPKTCSEIVWWLRDLMRPIPPAGDFRPYLHIHDHDFSLLVNANKPQAGVVVGVTNPFFRNAASHWPNVISIPTGRPKRVPANGTSSPRPEQPEGFLTRRQRHVQKDRPLLRRLEALVAEGRLDDPAGNDALRAHFQQLTDKFLVPLNRYFQTLIPTLSPVPTPSPSPSPVPRVAQTLAPPAPSSAAGSPNPAAGAAVVRPFSLPAFLAHLRATGPNPLAFRTKGLSTKTRVETDFYTAFCMGGCFAAWLAGRVDSVGAVVARGAGPSPAVGLRSGASGHLAVPTARHDTRRPPTPPSPQPVGLGISSPTLPLDLNDAPRPMLACAPGAEDGAETEDTQSVGTTEGTGTDGERERERTRASEESPRVARVADYDWGRRGSDGAVLSLGLARPS